MNAMRGLSLLTFALGVLLWALALALYLRGVLFPSGGFEDLGAIVGAMLLAGAAAAPFAFSLLFAQRGETSGWRVAVASVGCLVGVVMGVVWFGSGNWVSLGFGVPLLAFGLLGLWGAWRLRGRRA